MKVIGQLTPRPFLPHGNKLQVHTEYEAGWGPKLSVRFGEKNNIVSVGIRSQDHLVLSRVTVYDAEM